MHKQNKLLVFFLCLVLAIGFWAYVITTVSPGSEATYYNIPVILQGESLLKEKGLVNVTKEDPVISLTLYGNRSDLNKINASNITVTADLSHIYDPGDHHLNYDYVFPGDVASNAITVLTKEPSTVLLQVERLISKPVPVGIRYNGRVDTDYIVMKEERELDYEEIMITGPESVINRIAVANIDVDLEGRTSSFSENYRFTLCDARGNPVNADTVETNTGSVNLTLIIQRTKTLELTVKVIDGGGATKKTSEITIEPATIKVAGSEAVLKELESLELGTIDLKDWLKDGTKEFAIKLPAGVTDLGNTEKVTVTVKFPSLSSKTLTVTNIVAENVPEEIIAEIITQSAEVTLRGPKELMSRLTASDLKLVVDFTDAEVGTYSVKAELVIDSEFEGVGAIGSGVKVNVTCSEREKDK